MSRANVSLRIAGDTASAIVDGTAMPAIAYDDIAAWQALRLRTGRIARLSLTIAGDAVLPLALPVMPENGRDLTGMLEEFAPLRPCELVWTTPFWPSGDGQDMRQPMVSLVRRQWLDERIAAIRAGLGPVRAVILDEAGREFLYPGASLHRRSAVAIGALAAVAVPVALLALWPSFPRPVTQTAPPSARAVSGANAGVPDRAPAAAIPGPSPAASAGLAAGDGSGTARFGLSLVGIAGRIPGDAQVLVRTPWRKTVTLRIGDSVLGWRLVAVATDHVTFDRAGERRELRLKPAT